MTMPTLFFISMIILSLLVLAFLLGAHLNYNRGYWDGYDDSERSNAPNADHISTIKWQRYHGQDSAKF